MQATLNNFADLTQTQSLYSELVELGYIEGHKRQLLELLWDLKPHSTKEVMLAAGAQYNARVLELRREGWEIQSFRSLGEGPKFFFQLNKRNRRWSN